MIPGFSAVPMMMRGGVVVPAEPFSLSGSWETGAEGWVDATYGGNVEPVTGLARTGDYRLGGSAGAPWYFDYTLPSEVVRGLRITASIYHRSDGASVGTRSLSYRIGSGSFITLATVTNNTQTYALHTGNFINNSNDPVTIRLGLLNRGVFDDWAISGELP